MWRFALARRWWLGHLLVGVLCAVFIRLGRWQWDRGHSPSGDWQNLGYALQWPLFAVVLAMAWLRFLWLERRSTSEADSPAPETAPGSTVNPTPPVPRRPAYPLIREDDLDDELVAYNAYLAQLAEQDRR